MAILSNGPLNNPRCQQFKSYSGLVNHSICNRFELYYRITVAARPTHRSCGRCSLRLAGRPWRNRHWQAALWQSLGGRVFKLQCLSGTVAGTALRLAAWQCDCSGSQPKVSDPCRYAARPGRPRYPAPSPGRPGGGGQPRPGPLYGMAQRPVTVTA